MSDITSARNVDDMAQAIARIASDARLDFTMRHYFTSHARCLVCGDVITCKHDDTPMSSLPVEEV